MKRKYNLWATLFDSFAYYEKSEKDTAFEELLGSINRTGTVGDAARKGTLFNEIVDSDKPLDFIGDIYEGNLMKDGFDIPVAIIENFRNKFNGALRQIYVESFIDVSGSNVMLYGYVDEIIMEIAFDIKTTSKYEFPKYIHTYQKDIYPYCLNKEGNKIELFEYTITDFKNIYVEQYPYNEQKSTNRISEQAYKIIDFIETNRDLITNQKIFNYEQ
jgi:hypothetical protein